MNTEKRIKELRIKNQGLPCVPLHPTHLPTLPGSLPHLPTHLIREDLHVLLLRCELLHLAGGDLDDLLTPRGDNLATADGADGPLQRVKANRVNTSDQVTLVLALVDLFSKS